MSPFRTLLLAAWLLSPLAQAAQVELQLVVHDQPGMTVDKMEKRRPITNPVSTPRGIVMQQVGLDLACWARNVLLDDKPVFERYHENRYIDRLPVARAELAAGEHRIWPGDHVFTVAADGAVSSTDPELLIEGGVVKVKCYPVVVRAYRANPDEGDLPMSMRILPLPNLTIRESADAEANAPKKKGDMDKSRDLLPVFDKFAPLTIWLPANAVGMGYVVHPVGLTFHVVSGAVQAGAGGGQNVPGLRVAGNLIEIPLYNYGLTGAAGARAVVPGVEQFQWAAHETGQVKQANWYPRAQAYEVQLAERGPVITINGDLQQLPLKGFNVDIADPVSGAERALSVELDKRHTAPGGTLRVRVCAIDLQPAVTADRRAAAARRAGQAAEAEVVKGTTALAEAEKVFKDLDAKLAARKEAAAKLAAAHAGVQRLEAETAQAAKDVDAARQAVTAAEQVAAQARAALAAAAAVPAPAPAPVAPPAAPPAAEPPAAVPAADGAAVAPAPAVDPAVAAAAQEAARKQREEAAAAQAAARKLLEQAVADADKALGAARARVTELEAAVKARTDELAVQRDVVARAVPAETDPAPLEAETATAGQAVATAQAALEAAKALVPPAIAEADLLETNAVAAAAVNPLAGAVPFAQLQAFGAGTWSDLAVRADGESVWQIAIGEVPDGVYRLRVGVTPPDAPDQPLQVRQWISVAGDRGVGAGLFTPRGRDAFYRGESFWFGIGAIAIKGPIPAGAPVEATLVDAQGRRLPLIAQTLKREIKTRDALIVRIGSDVSLALAAGRYTVEASVAGQRARPLRLDIVDPEPESHFTNLLNGKYNSMGGGGDYQRILRNGEDAEDLARAIRRLGYNAFMGMTYDMDRVTRHGADLEQLVRERPELGPWESYYRPSGRDQFLNAAVRNNLRFYEDMFTYNDTMMPREPEMLSACERFVALEIASMRHSPVFHGVCLYDEFYNSGDSGSSQAMLAMHYKAQEMTYRARYEKEGYTSARAMRSLDRYAGRPFGQRQVADLEVFRTWPNHEDLEWNNFSKRMVTMAKTVMPESRNFTQMRFWGGTGGNIAANGTPFGVFGDLDMAACVMYKDGGQGDRPVFAPMEADAMRIRDDFPVWTQLHSYHAPGLFGMHIVRQAFLGLSQDVDGFTYFTFGHDLKSHGEFDDVHTIRNVADRLLTPYGDMFLALQRGYKKVAVYYSRQAAVLQPRKQTDIGTACEGLWVACLRAGFPADFLYDEQVLAGRGQEYDVIFVPGIQYEDETPPEILAALQKLVDGGKILAVERSSKLPIERIQRLDSELDDYDDKLGGAFPRYTDFETEMVLDRSEGLTVLVRDFLGKHIAPAAEHNMVFGPDWLKKGLGEYMVMANFAPTRFDGLYKTLYQAPDMPTLKFPRRPPFCYDILEMKPVEVATEGERMTLQADLRAYPGKVYAFLPAAIDRVALRASADATAGSALQYEVSVLDAGGKAIDAAFPIEITLKDASGAVRYAVYRAAAPVFRGACSLPVNVDGGAWKLSVREWISGATAEMAVNVRAGQLPAPVLDETPVRMGDVEKLKAFVAAAGPLTVVLDADQDWAKGVAEQLAQGLRARGREVRIAQADEVVRLPVDWDADAPNLDGSRLWRGDVVQPGLLVDGPVVLLGRRLESRMIEALARRDVLAEPLSENFPGPGRAIVTWVPRAFSTDADAVTVLAMDEEGLRRGVDELLAVEKRPAAAPVHPALTVAAVDAQAALADATGRGRQAGSYRDRVSMLEPIRTVDVDPASGRIVVGTFGYGDNLFCFAPDGKLLWKKFLPEHNVYFARWYDEGRRIVASTGRGFLVFLLNADDGSVIRKFASTEWPRGHGYGGFWEGAHETELQIELNPPLRQILVGGLTGLMAIDYDGRKMWFRDRAETITTYPAEAEQSKAATFPQSMALGTYSRSPDGLRVAQSEFQIIGSTPGLVPGTVDDLWAFRAVVMDARTGEVQLQNHDDPGSVRGPGGWGTTWPDGAELPLIRRENLFAPLKADGGVGEFKLREGWPLPGGRSLLIGESDLRLRDAEGRAVWRTAESRPWIRQLDTLNADATRLFRCDIDGGVRCVDLATGQPVWERTVPFSGRLGPLPDGGVLVGMADGGLVLLGADGAVQWQTRVGDLHEIPGRDYPAYIRAALLRDPDSTGEFFPVGRDAPGDYEKILRLGIEQAKNNGFEQDEAWTSADGDVTRTAPGHAGALSLELRPAQLVTQKLMRRVVPQATYLLEFHYQVSDTATRLTAGALLDGAAGGQTLTASKFAGRPGVWEFGRVAVKTLASTTALALGLEAEGGVVRVDDVSFRAVRFPSANLLAIAELHAVEPTYVSDIRVQYSRLPAGLKEKLMSRNHVAAYKQGEANTATIYTQEEAFLHNGRLDDIGNIWAYPPDGVGFSVVLAKSAWISHFVIYLNNSQPDNVYRFMSILANDHETRLPRQVKLIRGNERRFVVAHFDPPIFTDSIKILQGKHRGHRECLTEVELYGPLGGPGSEQAGFPADPLGWPMLMGAPSHVPATLPADLTGRYVVEQDQRFVPDFHAGITAAGGLFTASDPVGVVRSLRIDPPLDKQNRREAWGPTWPLASVTPLGTPARYAGRLLTGSADFRLHAVSDEGIYLWGFQTGARVHASPVPDGDDVYVGSDDGHLYKIDIHSGTLIWEFETGGRVRGSPALAEGRLFAVSWNGFLHAVDAETGLPVWKAAIAPFTRSSPAVRAGNVYIGDEQGGMHCFRAADGAPVWQRPLGAALSRCPVVTADGVFFAADKGAAAFLAAADGAVRWQKDLGMRVTGQPVATQTQLLIPGSAGLRVLRQGDGQPDDRFTPPAAGQVLGAVPYGTRLCLMLGSAYTDYHNPPWTYAYLSGGMQIWAPAPVEAAK